MKYRFLEGIPSPLSELTYGTPWTATREDTRAEAFKSYDMAWERDSAPLIRPTAMALARKPWAPGWFPGSTDRKQ